MDFILDQTVHVWTSVTLTMYKNVNAYYDFCIEKDNKRIKYHTGRKVFFHLGQNKMFQTDLDDVVHLKDMSSEWIITEI